MKIEDAILVAPAAALASVIPATPFVLLLVINAIQLWHLRYVRVT